LKKSCEILELPPPEPVRETAAMAITLGRGDSVILAGNGVSEVIFKSYYSSNQVRMCIIAEKSVKILRRKAEKPSR
jgi:hypothetical protein